MHHCVNEMPSMGLIVEPVVFSTIHTVFDLEKENENNLSLGKYNGKNMITIAMI